MEKNWMKRMKSEKMLSTVVEASYAARKEKEGTR